MSRTRWRGAAANGSPSLQLVPASTALLPARSPWAEYPARPTSSSCPTAAPPFAAR